MSLAVLRAMLLGLVRDRTALVMSFVLPAIFFLIFAAIFSGSTGEELRLRVALADEQDTEISRRLVGALRRDPALLPVGETGMSADRVRELVRRGSADAGIILRAGGEPLDAVGGFGDAPILIITDPVRGVAAPMLTGQVQKAYFSALPDVALGSVITLLEDQFLELDTEQREDVEAGLEDLRIEAEEARKEGRDAGWGFEELFEREDVAGRSAALNHVAYYAGAVAVLFLLFSAAHGAITLLEERESGILDRMLAGPGRSGVMVNGKFLFLMVQGFVQVGVIFLIAWIVHGVDLPGHLGPWAGTTLATSGATAGLALALAAACRTRRQAQTIANVAILVVSAVGGSMVPRFLMPSLLRDLGWLTPNTWALEAYTATFWRDEPSSALLLPWTMLLLAAVFGLLLSRRLARRLEIL